jgi:hypothetical protein
MPPGAAYAAELIADDGVTGEASRRQLLADNLPGLHRPCLICAGCSYLFLVLCLMIAVWLCLVVELPHTPSPRTSTDDVVATGSCNIY